MNYAQNSDNSLTGVGAVNPPLERILERIRHFRSEMGEIATKLDAHADQLHGPVPEDVARQECRPVRSGIIGAIEDALDDLQQTHSAVAIAAGRNCTLI